MLFELLLLLIILLSIPTYKIINTGQICLFIACSIITTSYFLKGFALKKWSRVSLPTVILVIVAISYNLKVDKGWISYIPFAQLLIVLIFIIYVLVVSKIKKTDLIQYVTHRTKKVSLVFVCLAIIFMVLAIAGWINFLSADLFYKRGNSQLINGKIDEAILNFTKAIDKKPNLYPVYPKLCSILYKKGRYDEVINICKKGLPYLRMTPDYYDVFCFYLGSSYFRKEKLDEALSYYDKLMRVDKDNSLEREFGDWIELNFYKGYRYSRFKRWDEAIKEYETALLVEPKNSITRFKIGEAYYFLGKSEDALKIFEDLINSGFNHRDAFLYIADLYTNESMFNKAISMYKRYATTDFEKDNTKEAYLRGYVEIGKIYEKQNDSDKAIAAYKELLLFPETELCGHRYLGNVFVRFDRFNEAIEEYKKLLINNKSLTAEGNFLIGEVYMQMGDIDTAKDYYMRTIKLGYHKDKESYLQAIKRIGQLYRSKGLFNVAIKYYEKLKNIRPAQMYFEIALSYINDKGLLDKALLICDEGYKNEQAKSEPYTFASVYQYLLEKYKERGQSDKIIYISERLLTYNPVFVRNWEQVGIDLIKVYLDNNKYLDALRIYNTILKFKALSKDMQDTLNKLLEERKNNARF